MATMFMELMVFYFSGEAILGIFYYLSKHLSSSAPFFNAIKIRGSVLIIYNKRHDTMAKAFFEHQEPANSTIAVSERHEHFKLHVKVQNIRKLRIVNAFVI